MIIYKITNSVNGKIYIGKTSKPIEKRLQTHFRNAVTCKRRSRLYSAIRKYGCDKFSIEVIHTLTKDEESKVDYYERYYIKLFNSKNHLVGYNMTDGGDGGKNEASMLTSSLLRSGKTYAEIYGSVEKAKMVADKMSQGLSLYWKGKDRIIPESAKRKMSETKRRLFQEKTEEEKIKVRQRMQEIRVSRKGCKHTEETKNKLSKIQTGKTWEERMGLEKTLLNKEMARLRFIGEQNPNYVKISPSKYIDILASLSENPLEKMSDLCSRFMISPFLLRSFLRKINIDNLQKFRYHKTENELRNIFNNELVKFKELHKHE